MSYLFIFAGCLLFLRRFDSVVMSESQNNTLVAELTREEFTVLKTWGGGLQVSIRLNKSLFWVTCT